MTTSLHDTFLDLRNGEKALSRGFVRNIPILVAGVTREVDFNVPKLLRDVDIVLGMNWLESGNPLIDWCAGKT